MDCIAQLKKAMLLNKEGNPTAALDILKNLYKSDTDNLDIIQEVVTGYENLGDRKKARTMLRKGISLSPQNCDLWIRLSRNYQADKNLESALEILNEGLDHNPDNLPLLTQKSHLLADLGRDNEMRSLVNDTIRKFPGYTKDLLIERASIYQRLSLHPDDAEEQLKDCCGIAYAVGPLKKAINDLNDAMDCDDEDFRIPLKLARLYKQLNDFELAIFTYDSALRNLDSKAEEFRISIQQERDDCLNNSRNDAEQIVNTQCEDLVQVKAETVLVQEKVDIELVEVEADTEAEPSYDNNIARDLPKTRVHLYTPAIDRALPQEINREIQARQKAISIAQYIPKNAHEPNAGYIPAQFAKSMQKFCDQVEKDIKKNDFITLGDYESTGHNPYLRKQVFLRLFVSRDHKICAAAIQIKPLKHSLLALPLLGASGKWKTIRYVELQSESVDGVFKITNNSGDANPFVAGNPVKIINLPEKSLVFDIVKTHSSRLQQPSQRSYKLIPDIKEFFALQERIRLAKEAFQKSSGAVAAMG
jgi:tetratricopeptide (TPR) repeat protein